MDQHQISDASAPLEKPTVERNGQFLALASRGTLSDRQLLVTKLHIPNQNRSVLVRSRLISVLEDVPHTPLTLVCASAGSGKTTLLSEWAGTSGYRVAWLSLDGSDNDPIRFWEYWIGAIRMVEPAFGENALMILHSRLPIPDNQDLFLTTLLNEISSFTDDLAVVLDDYHLIDEPGIHTALAYLCEHIPAQIHLLIASRTQPPLPLSRLRARSHLIEISQEDLNFTPSEADEYFRKVEHFFLSEQNIYFLQGKTEGWIAGIKLAALSLKKHYNPSEFIRGLTGSHIYISDYLTQEVLRQQPAYIQDFLLNTSILDHFCASLCDAVIQTSALTDNPSIDRSRNSQSILEYLASANIFVQSLDEERQWYRYHHLFADLLREILQKTYPERISELYERAGAWYEARGYCSDAVQTALTNHNYEHAADLIECNCQQMAKRSELHTLSKWIEALPIEMVRKRPKLCLAKAWALLPSIKLVEVETWLRYAENAGVVSSQGEVEEGEKQRIKAEAATIHAMMALLQYKLPDMISFSNQALDALQADQDFERGLVNLSLGVVHLLSGNLEAANRSLVEAASLPQISEDILLAYLARYYLAQVANKKGQLHKAFEYLMESLQFTGTKTGMELPAASLAHIMLAGIYYEWNELETALAHVETGLNQSQYWWVNDAVIEGYFTLARIRKAQGRLEEAVKASQKSSQLAEQNHARPFITHESIPNLQSWQPSGSLDTALKWAESFEQSLQASDGLDFGMLAQAPAAAHLLVAAGRHEQAQRLITPLLVASQEQGLGRQVVELLVLQAMMFSSQQDTIHAMLAISQALDAARLEEYIRVFVDEGAPMHALLLLARERGVTPAYTEKLLAAFGEQGQRQPPGMTLLVEPLSSREVQVLGLLAGGLSPEQIAEELVITVGTTRNHLHHIYAKLQVKTQLQAVERARELGML